MIRGFTLKEYAAAAKKVWYDPAFDRRYGAWVDTKKRNFLKNVIDDKVDSMPVWADIDECLSHSVLVGDRGSKKKLQDLKDRGYKYISLDGKHRTKTVEAFMNSDLTITHTIKDCEGQIHNITNKHWCKFPSEVKPQIFMSKINVRLVTSEVYGNFGKRYRDLNDGEPPNPQEVRNSYSSPVAQYIRDESERLRSAMERVVKNKYIERMMDDELVVKTYIHLIQRYNRQAFSVDAGFQPTVLDKWYTVGNDVRNIDSNGSPYIKAEFDRAKQIMNTVSKMLLEQEDVPNSKTVSHKMYWAFVFAAEWAHNEDYNVVDYITLTGVLKNLDDELSSLSLTEHSKEEERKRKNGEELQDIDRNQYYYAWAQLVHQSKYRVQRRDAFVARIKKEVSKNGPSSMGLVEMQSAAA